MITLADLQKLLTDFAKQNPVGAGLVLGGVSVIAAALWLLGIGLDLNTTWPVFLWVIGIGFLLAVLAYICTHPILMPLVASCLVLFAVAYGVVWVLAQALPTNTTLGCLAAFNCKQGADSSAAQDPASSDPLAATAEPQLPPPVTTNAPIGVGLDPLPNLGMIYPQTVYVQFAGAITRDSMRQFMRDMADAGWNVQGVEGGGERIASAAGLAEVRYHDAADRPAAEALVAYLNYRKVIDKTFEPKQNDIIQPGVLELWMGR